MSGHSEALQLPVAKIRVLAQGRRRAAFAVLDKGSRTNVGGVLSHTPFAGLVELFKGAKK